MDKSIFFLLAILFLANCKSSDRDDCNQNGGTLITIRAQDSKPLESVQVRIDGTGNSKFTNANGIVEFDLAPGRYNVILDKDHYEPSSPQDENFIEITCNAFDEIEFRMKANSPILAVSNNELHFGNNTNLLSLDIFNAGIGEFNWEIKNLPKWVIIAPGQLSGTVSNGQSPIEVEVDRTELPLGENQGEFTIRAEDLGSIQIKVFVNVVPPFFITPSELNFGAVHSDQSFNINLDTPVEVNYSISKNKDWIIIQSPTTGVLNSTSQSDNIIVKIDRNQFSSYGHYFGQIQVEGNGISRILNVLVEQVDPNAPKLVVSHEYINFGVANTEVSLTLSNTGISDLEVAQMTTDVPWLSFNDFIPPISNTEPYHIVLTVDREILSQGEHGGNISLKTNGGDKVIPISIEKDSENIVLELGKIAHYPFNGHPNDISDDKFFGSLSGATLATDRNGNTDACYFFDGTDDYIGIVNPVGSGTGQYSIAFWMNNYSFGSSPEFILSLRGPVRMDVFIENVDGKNLLNWRSYYKCNLQTARWEQTKTNNFESGQWNHVVCIFNKKTTPSNGEKYLELYVNGVLMDRTSIEQPNCPYSDTGVSSSIGAHNQASGHWNGYLDDLRVYSRALTPEEIQLLYCLENTSSDCN